MALNVLISEYWWLVWCHTSAQCPVCPEVCTGTSPGHDVGQPVMRGASRQTASCLLFHGLWTLDVHTPYACRLHGVTVELVGVSGARVS